MNQAPNHRAEGPEFALEPGQIRTIGFFEHKHFEMWLRGKENAD